ncbi:hypothetical protein JMUB5695_01683 [Mycobacterium heckeshornense]|uniref:hypothetical protein n=1 Tax=Mycobacterium heckeshornense TaxID=110505 RepID=UPI00194595F3|nr:hypothetical protein [Mycobacterium heckeshornense]BCQ07725.1 hypothetical protein JMUB5695_01146 [Mycobacterium heckeshornense]BCQ08258.1 hypothetical protein JMUB5695_01683 [Mycobacterium heckeshornense]
MSRDCQPAGTAEGSSRAANDGVRQTHVTRAAELAEAAGYLGECRNQLREALTRARWAEERLSGARAARALELGERIADTIAYCERLRFVVEGDLRAEGYLRAELGGTR